MGAVRVAGLLAELPEGTDCGEVSPVAADEYWRLVQVNLGNFGSWDLHGNNFHCLKHYLLPPTDLAVSGLLDDLHDSGLLGSTLVVMAGEFGRTPRITHIAPEVYKYPGRDH